MELASRLAFVNTFIGLMQNKRKTHTHWLFVMQMWFDILFVGKCVFFNWRTIISHLEMWQTFHFPHSREISKGVESAIIFNLGALFFQCPSSSGWSLATHLSESCIDHMDIDSAIGSCYTSIAWRFWTYSTGFGYIQIKNWYNSSHSFTMRTYEWCQLKWTFCMKSSHYDKFSSKNAMNWNRTKLNENWRFIDISLLYELIWLHLNYKQNKMRKSNLNMKYFICLMQLILK